MKRLISKTYTELKEQGELERYLYTIEPTLKQGNALSWLVIRNIVPKLSVEKLSRKIKSEAEKEISGYLMKLLFQFCIFRRRLRHTIVQMAKKQDLIQ